MTRQPSAASTRRTALPPVVYVLALGTFLMGTTEFVVAGMLHEVAADFNVAVAHAGLAITVFAVGMIVGAPMIALATLTLSRRLTLTLALVTYSAGHIIAALTASFGVMLAARFLTALATGAFWAVGSVVAAQSAGRGASARALGLVLGGGMLATVVGVPLGSLLGQAAGWRTPFWGLAVLSLLAAVAVFRLVPDHHVHRAAISLRAELAVLGHGRVWLTLATCALINAGVLSIYSFVSPLAIDRAGLPAAAIPPLLMGFGIAALIGNLLAGRLGDMRPFKTISAAVVATVVLTGAMIPFSAQPAIFVPLFVALGLVGLSSGPILVALSVRYGGAAPTLAAAMPTSIFNLGTAIGTGVVGAALDSRLGTLAVPVIGASFCVLILVPLSALVIIERRMAVRESNGLPARELAGSSETS